MVNKPKSRALTLVELLVVIAVVGVVGSVGYGVLLKMLQFYYLSAARVDIQRELRITLDNMDRTLRQASAASLKITENAGEPPYSKMTLTTVEGSSVTYSQSGHQLIQSVGSNQKILTQNLRYIAFTYPQTDVNSIVSVSITLEKKTFSGRTTALQMAITKVRVMNP